MPAPSEVLNEQARNATAQIEGTLNVKVLNVMAQIEGTLNDWVPIAETQNAKVVHSYQGAMALRAHYAVRYVVLHFVGAHYVAVAVHSAAALVHFVAVGAHYVAEELHCVAALRFFAAELQHVKVVRCAVAVRKSASTRAIHFDVQAA